MISGSNRILDIGCGSGPLGALLRKYGHQIEIVGIDKDSKALETAAPSYDRVFSMDLDAFVGIPYPQGYFDAIVLADVLEHLKTPNDFLRTIGKYLAPTGMVVISLPNVARLEVRIKLLLGKFNYTPSGIMDKTHLHFYTYSTARSLVENAGFVIRKIEYTGLGSRLRAFPRVFSYQFIMAARQSGARP
jgi:2-polyprenyl-3-methyl-5-hydroxy-6-metoxy-1,4-benzoquinol methylase